jgi:putative transposase
MHRGQTLNIILLTSLVRSWHNFSMPRPPRLEYEGAVYHLTSRGNGRQTIFQEDADRQHFLAQLQDNLETFDVVLHAFVLMTNHYHLLIRTCRANLSRFAQRLNTSYALYYRYKHNHPGHLFQGRYTAKLVDGDSYLLRLTRYIHLNPVKTAAAEHLTLKQRIALLSSYRWSSYPGYVSSARALPWIDYSILKGHGKSWSEARQRYRRYAESMVMSIDESLQQAMGANPYALGDEPFVQSIEAEFKTRKQGTDIDRDLALPRGGVELDDIDLRVAAAYGVPRENLRLHGHAAKEAKMAAVEIAARLSGLTQREIGRHYGGISSSAVAMIRGKVRKGGKAMRERIAGLTAACRTSKVNI